MEAKLLFRQWIHSSQIKDEYNHIYPLQHRVAMGNYLEILKHSNNGTTCHLNKKVIPPCYSIVLVHSKRRGKIKYMYFVTHYIYEEICNVTFVNFR